MMYIKKILEIGKDEEKKINEKIEATRELVLTTADKVVKKIESHYDNLLNSIDGEFIDFTISLEGRKFEFRFSSNTNTDINKKRIDENSKFVAMSDTTSWTNNTYIINSDPEIKNLYLYNRLIRKGIADYEYIEILMKHENEILDKFKDAVEEKIKNRYFEKVKELEKKHDLLNEMEKYLNEEENPKGLET